MKKESLIAIFLGLIFGLFGAILIINTFSHSDSEKGKNLISEKKEITLSPVKTIDLEPLIINNPKNNIVVNTDQISIEGSADKNSLIVIQSPAKDTVFQNKDKKFKVDFPLVLGENVIKIVVYSKNINLKNQEKTLFVYYLPNEI